MISLSKELESFQTTKYMPNPNSFFIDFLIISFLVRDPVYSASLLLMATSYLDTLYKLPDSLYMQ